MPEFVFSAIAGVLCQLLFAWLLRSVLPQNAEKFSARTGDVQKIELSLPTMFFSLIVGAAGAILTVYVGFTDGLTIISIGGLLFMAIFAGSLWGIVNRQFVCWDEEGLWGNGTCRFGLLGRHVRLLRWEEIRELGATISGYDFVEAGDERRVYWSHLYNGRHNGRRDLVTELYERRPDLFE